MTVTNRTHEHDRIIQRLIVERGMSYAGAIQWCEREAERLAGPYLAAADELRGWLTSSPTTSTQKEDTDGS